MGLKIEKYVTTQLCIVSCLYLSNIMVGYSLGWNGVIVPKLMDPHQTPLSDTISLLDASWLGSSAFVGLIIGSPITSHLATVIGRKKCLFIASSLLLVANLILTFAKSFRVIIIGRIINGLGVSIADALNMVYIGEIASSNIRGILLSLTGVFLSLGNLLIFSSGPFVSYAVVGYIVLPFCVVVIIGYCFLPESPLYYVIKGDEEEAKTILRKLGRDKDIDSELSRLTKLVEEQKNERSCNTLFAVKSNRKALMITSILYVIQESNGMIYILYYVTTIFATAASSVDPRLATVLIGLTNTCTVILVPIFIERAGRRILLLLSTAGCFLCTTSLGIYFYLTIAREDIAASISWLPLAALILMCISFNLGLGVLPNTLMGEMFRPNVRSIGSSISLTICWIAALTFVGLHGYLTEIVGSYLVFAMCAVINALGFVFVVTVVPETKGMSLTQIEQLMSGK